MFLSAWWSCSEKHEYKAAQGTLEDAKAALIKMYNYLHGNQLNFIPLSLWTTSSSSYRVVTGWQEVDEKCLVKKTKVVLSGLKHFKEFLSLF